MFEQLLNGLLDDMEIIAGWLGLGEEEEDYLEDLEELKDEV